MFDDEIYRNLAGEIKEKSENIILIYAFNGTGKTRLSVAFKDISKIEDRHTGVYYNAYSEDLFVWDNDEEHDNANVKLKIVQSTLNQHHSFLFETERDESDREINLIQKYLKPYNPKYTFKLNPYYVDGESEEIDLEKGIDSVSFFSMDDEELKFPIKISRGEERIFVWCFFLALFEKLAVEQEFIFIDDPISSLDDNNVFITAYSLLNLIKIFYGGSYDFTGSRRLKKIIITTHHIGFATILDKFFTKSEIKDKFKRKYLPSCLKANDSSVYLDKADVLLYHLHLLEYIKHFLDSGETAKPYHVALLRQLLENVASFLGAPRFGYALEVIGYNHEEAERNAFLINEETHKNIYYTEENLTSDQRRKLIGEIYDKMRVLPFTIFQEQSN